MIRGRFVPPPAAYAVSNHSWKNCVNRALHAPLGLGSHWWKAASSCGSVMLLPPYWRWSWYMACVKLVEPRIWRNAMYAMPGRLYKVFEHYKRDEWERYLAAVTDWERNEYLEVLP